MKDQAVIDGTTVRIDSIQFREGTISNIMESQSIRTGKQQAPAPKYVSRLHAIALEYGRDILGVDTGLMQPARRIL